MCYACMCLLGKYWFETTAAMLFQVQFYSKKRHTYCTYLPMYMYNKSPALTSCLASTVTAQDFAIPKETTYIHTLFGQQANFRTSYTNGCVCQLSSLATVVFVELSFFVWSRSFVFRLWYEEDRLADSPWNLVVILKAVTAEQTAQTQL